jgi:hypothetical protein
MAGNLILMKSDKDTFGVKTDNVGYEDYLVLEKLTFGFGASHSMEEDTANVTPGTITLTVKRSPSVALLQNALYAGQDLGKVTLVEVSQKLDDNKNKTYKKVREIVVTDGYVGSMNHEWNAIGANYTFTLSYKTLAFNWKDKSAAYEAHTK